MSTSVGPGLDRLVLGSWHMHSLRRPALVAVDAEGWTPRSSIDVGPSRVPVVPEKVQRPSEDVFGALGQGLQGFRRTVVFLSGTLKHPGPGPKTFLHKLV